MRLKRLTPLIGSLFRTFSKIAIWRLDEISNSVTKRVAMDAESRPDRPVFLAVATVGERIPRTRNHRASLASETLVVIY